MSTAADLEARERKRSRTRIWVGLTIGVAALCAAGVSHRRIEVQVDAWLHPAPTERAPDSLPNPTPPSHEPTPLERAAKLREEAFANVAKGYMGDAEDELDEASDLDSAGNGAQAVLDARKAIFEKRPRPPQSKTAVAPWEKPLKKTILR